MKIQQQNIIQIYGIKKKYINNNIIIVKFVLVIETNYLPTMQNTNYREIVLGKLPDFIQGKFLNFIFLL